LVFQLREQENIIESLILIGATSQRRSSNLSVASLLQASFHDYVPDSYAAWISALQQRTMSPSCMIKIILLMKQRQTTTHS
jgi:hypothetical protein